MIRDLLVPTSGYLELRDDPNKGIEIAGISEVEVKNEKEVTEEFSRLDFEPSPPRQQETNHRGHERQPDE